MRVLIVDDSKAMRMIVRRTLRQAGFDGHEVEECANGVEGLAAQGTKPFNVILSDWNMPEMTGIDFLRALRATGDRVTFGFVTSECSEDMKNLAIEAGAAFFVTKPFTPESFQEKLSGFIR